MENRHGKEEAMQKVRETMFAVNEIALYLDTHPQDRNALQVHKKYVEEYKEAKKHYEENFGPLSIYTENDNWSWVYDKWPWEGGDC